jgi:hypothetical protein
MNRNLRTLGVASTTRAYALVVLDGYEIVYYWSEDFDKEKSPVQNLVAARKKLMSAMSHLRPGHIGCTRPKLSRVMNQTVPIFLHAEVRWISRKRMARFSSFNSHRLRQSIQRRRMGPKTREPDAYARAEAEILQIGSKRKLSPDSKKVLVLALETARNVRKPAAEAR